jgi:hypothetical protein
MRNVNRPSLAVLLCAIVFCTAPQGPAHADVIGTQQYLHAVDREAAIARIDSVLARDEVRKALERHGVDRALVDERVAALTDDELQKLADDLDGQPAGGELLAVIGIVFIVLLILEALGVIHIFKKF